MKKILVLILVILFAGMSFVGCTTEPPKPPAYDVPKIVLDYSEQETGKNKTAIFIHGIEDVMYDRLVLEVNNETIEKVDAFSIEYETNLTQFEINSDVYREEDEYNFNATVETFHDDEAPNRFTITYPDENEEDIKSEDLPFIERFNKMED
ncbi:MAG: hypothetical protein R6W73_07805 [Candidatus Saliniplasma sp.]